MEDAAMDTNDHIRPIKPNAKRRALNNSIQTNFGDDYVFQIASNFDSTLMAVSLSTNTLKLYSPSTGQYFGECRGHSATINHISFSGPLGSTGLYSCASDGTVRAWDSRTCKQVFDVSDGSQEIFTFAFGGCGDNLLAAGCKSQILFWDWRKKGVVACLEDSHFDDVTQVHYVPGHENKLISASVDGLICTFNTGGHINDEDSLESVMNVGTSIARVGLFGNDYRKLWCLTHIETLSIWSWEDSTHLSNLSDARWQASSISGVDHVDYFVDCFGGDEERLWAIGGSNSGTLGFFVVDYKQGQIDSAEAVLEGGHTGVVRSMLLLSNRTCKGVFGWSGGEDGRLCCWSSDEAAIGGHSWMSGGFVARSSKHLKGKRHHPY